MLKKETILQGVLAVIICGLLPVGGTATPFAFLIVDHPCKL